MKLGQRAMEALQEEITGKLNYGDDIIVAGPVGFQGTILLAEREKEYLRQFFSEGFLWTAVREIEFDYETIIPKEKLTAVYPLEKGGVLAGLWKMAEVSGTGLRIDLRKIPIRQETVEICERFDLDPYKLLSGGSVLMGSPDGREAVERFQEKGIRAAVIGAAVEGNDRLLKSGEVIRYLNRPSQDEITKLAWGDKWRTAEKIPGTDGQEGNR